MPADGWLDSITQMEIVMCRSLVVGVPRTWTALLSCVMLVGAASLFVFTDTNRLSATQPAAKADLFEGKWNGRYENDAGQKGTGTYVFHKEKAGRFEVTVTWRDEKGKSYEMKLQGERLGLDGASLTGEYEDDRYRYLGRMQKGALVLRYLSVNKKTGETGSGVSTLTRPK